MFTNKFILQNTVLFVLIILLVKNGHTEEENTVEDNKPLIRIRITKPKSKSNEVQLNDFQVNELQLSDEHLRSGGTCNGKPKKLYERLFKSKDLKGPSESICPDDIFLKNPTIEKLEKKQDCQWPPGQDFRTVPDIRPVPTEYGYTVFPKGNNDDKICPSCGLKSYPAINPHVSTDNDGSREVDSYTQFVSSLIDTNLNDNPDEESGPINNNNNFCSFWLPRKPVRHRIAGGSDFPTREPRSKCNTLNYSGQNLPPRYLSGDYKVVFKPSITSISPEPESLTQEGCIDTFFKNVPTLRSPSSPKWFTYVDDVPVLNKPTVLEQYRHPSPLLDTMCQPSLTCKCITPCSFHKSLSPERPTLWGKINNINLSSPKSCVTNPDTHPQIIHKSPSGTSVVDGLTNMIIRCLPNYSKQKK